MKQVGIPLILTFKLDSSSQERLDEWRARYFPPQRNYLKAHLTIYHQLPGQMLGEIRELLRDFAENHSSIALSFNGLITRGGFVGVSIESKELLETRVKLSQVFGRNLRAQDQQPYRPHVTVTNLGSPKEAEKCFAALSDDFVPWSGEAIGLELFHYRNGPWELAQTFLFANR